MEKDNKAELESFLKVIPPVEFCCVYGSALHPNNHDKSKLVDYILGVPNPQEWHAENLKLNRDHYASCILRLGGARLVTEVADKIGVGVHFNPYVNWNDKMFKYGVVRMHDLVQDILNWERFYLCGRLQKPVHILVDNLDVESLNSVNLRAAVSAALLLLPMKFSEEDLYAKICSLSYTGDLRMLFAEDRHKDLLAAHTLVSSLPPAVRSEMATKLGEKKCFSESGQAVRELMISSREEAAKCMQKILKRKVMVSSARQAISGLLAVGGVNGMRYLASKMTKAWKSWT
ncbi:Mitochondrial matrix Mmp [Trema orientale]|uniref:Phosphatidate cytidylyltransferase, mitochondrial n=1 Tax=Trema orientale TaxID=63057 RepID=A0A2P5BGU3_TREOI|nr:Mitochondrial matrix Mmp [Trema orientale]